MKSKQSHDLRKKLHHWQEFKSNQDLRKKIHPWQESNTIHVLKEKIKPWMDKNSTSERVKPFKCEICHMNFSQHQSLEFHSTSHKQQFQCQTCGTRYEPQNCLKNLLMARILIILLLIVFSLFF